MTQSWQNILSSLERIIAYGDQGETFDCISEDLSQYPQHISNMRQLFMVEKDADRRDIILTALSAYAADEIENLITPPKNIRQAFHHFLLPQYLYEFSWYEKELSLYILDTDHSDWSLFLEILRLGHESFSFSLEGAEAHLPLETEKLFSDFRDESPCLIIDCGATLVCKSFEEGRIQLKLGSKPDGAIDLFNFMASISVLLGKSVCLAYEHMAEQPLFLVDPEDTGFEYFPQNSLSPVSPGNSTRPQLKIQNLYINEPLQTWGDLLVRLDWDVSLTIGDKLIFTKTVKAAELARQLESWHREGFKEHAPFVYNPSNEDAIDFIHFCYEGDMWSIESSLISCPELVPKVTDLQLRWCIETFIMEVFNATQDATGQRLSLIFKGMYGVDEKLS